MVLSQSPSVKRQIRNLQASRPGTVALTTRVHPMDLLFAVMLCVLHVSSLGYPEAHSTHPSSIDQADGESRKGRRFQGVRGVADQIRPVKRCSRPDSDSYICPRRLDERNVKCVQYYGASQVIAVKFTRSSL